MKNNLFKFFIGIFLVMAVISCNKDDATEIIPELQLMDVVFDINNFLPQDGSKNLFSSKENGDNDPLIPNCSDLEPSYVIINIDGDDYTLQLVTLNDNTETEVIKLLAGDYVINSFIVYAADGTPIWASPFMQSYYQTLWDLRGVNELPFTVAEFDKVKIELDVLCYRPFDYEKFGFAWFAYSRIEIHTVCFFGDICTKFYEEFHMEGSAYFGQEYSGYDFPAIFYINVKNEQGEIVNDNRPIEGIYPNSNLSWFGVGSPLCIEYPDIVGVEEMFTFEIMLKMPSGAWELVYTGEFNDTAMSIAGEDNFGGTDGVFDFVVGNCSYDGNNANVELPAYLPIPISADMVTSWGPQGFDIYEFYMTFTNYNPGPIPGLFDENIAYRTLCGEEDVDVYVPGSYVVDFYSSLDLSTIPAPYNTYPWGSMNYLANNCDPYTWEETQQAIWHIMNPTGTTYGVNNQLAQDAMANPGFVPTVGDYACVLVIPFSDSDESRAYQLLLRRIDP